MSGTAPDAAIRDLDGAPLDLAALSGFRDEIGVVSVYVDADPSRQAGARPPWAIEVEDGLKRVVETLAKEDADAARSVEDAIERMRPQLDALVDPASSGRGRVLFAAASDARSERHTFQLPLETRVVLQPSAFVRPLVRLEEEGRPAGLVRVSRHTVDVIEWNAGSIRELASYGIDVDTSEWTELKGPAGSNPARAQQTAPQRDRFERRLEQDQRREAAEHVDEIIELARTRGWSDLILAGDPRLTAAMREGFPADATDLVTEYEAQLNALTPADAVVAITPELEKRRFRRVLESLTDAVDRARAGGRGAIGLAATLSGLSEGRVEELFLEEHRRYTGFVSSDADLLVAEPSAVPVGARESLVPEPFLGERMIERAFETSARVRIVPADAWHDLGEDRVAALLRW